MVLWKLHQVVVYGTAWRRVASGFRGLLVWPILALGFRDLRLNRTGFRVLRCVRVAGLGHFGAWVSGIFHTNSYLFGFSNSYIPRSNTLRSSTSPQKEVQRVGENENAGNNRRLQTKSDDFCSEVQFRVLAFLLAGF